MGKRTEEPKEPTATTEQQTSHEPNAATQHLSTDSTQGDRHRRAGTRFKFRHKPRGPNTRSHDHCPSSHVDLHLPTCALLLAGLLATCVGNVPVEANPSGAWISKMLSAKTTPHSADALGNARCIVTNVSASAGDSSVNQHPPIKLSQQEIVRGRTPAPPPRLPEPSPAQLKAWPPPPPPRPIHPDAATMPRRPQRAALHPASTFLDDNSRQSPLPGPPRFATGISDLIGWLAGARHRLEDTVQRAAAAIAKVPWARPKYPKKKTKKTLSRNRTETETENAPAATAPLRTALPATGSQSASLQPVRRQSLAPASRVRSVWLRHAGLPNLPLMLHKRSCVEGVGITMEPDLRWTPPPLGPRLIPSELRNQSHATASGAAGLVPVAPGGHASAPASGAAGLVPVAPRGHASASASGAAGLVPVAPGGHASSASSFSSGFRHACRPCTDRALTVQT